MGWLLTIILAVLLYRARRELNALRSHVETAETESIWTSDGGKQASTPSLDHPLIRLRLQLRCMLEKGSLTDADYRRLSDKIDAYWVSEQKTTEAGTRSELWWASCQTGWNILTANGLVPYGPPPWDQASSRAETAPPDSAAVVKAPESEPAPTKIALSTPPGRSEIALSTPPERSEFEAKPAVAAAATTASSDPGNPIAGPSVPPHAQLPAKPPQRSVDSAPSVKHAWHPVEPGRLEQALRVVSGWPKLLVPFLVQNIGWFVGAFLFLAGTVFLVTYTTGYLKAAVVFASLFAYAVFLIWSGYKLLLNQPRMKTASTVLLLTGLLLVPLSISAATRLLMNAGDSPLLWTLGLAAAAICLGIVYAGAQLVAAVVHRGLGGEYARVFLGLAALQLGAPLIAHWPSWLSLSVGHVAILGILAYGLVRLADQWLRSVYVDNQKILLFAAGALLFAALTSFVHLTWGVAAVALPRGYYAPYLISLCGLLFYLDAQFKVQTHRHAFLSRLSFFIYGLSVVAVLLAMDAPIARLITLAMATGLYALVVWKHLSLIPLYLMLASLSALYAFAILAHFPAAAHFLLSVPGLVGLHALSRWASKSGIERLPTRAHGLWQLGLVTYRGALLLVAALAVWSLVSGGPSMLAMVSAWILAAGLWWMLRAGPGPIAYLRSGRSEDAATDRRLADHLQGPWLYGPLIAVSLACLFAPRINALSWAIQSSLALTLAACIWTALLMLGRRPGTKRSPGQASIFANSALLSVFVGSLLAALPLPGFEIHALTMVTLGVAAAVLLGLSLNLYIRWLFYLFLAWGGATAAAIKLSYFPGSSVGLSEILAAAALWGILWWLDRQPDELSAIARRRAWNQGPERLLWVLPGASSVRETSPLEPDKGLLPVNKDPKSRVSADPSGHKTAAMDEACV